MGFRSVFRRQNTTPTPTPDNDGVTQVEEKDEKRDIDGAAAESNGNGNGNEMETPPEELQRGVQDIEAMTQTWSKWALIAVFIKYYSIHTLSRRI